MSWEVRAAVAADVQGLVVLNAEVQALHFAHAPDCFKPPAASEVYAWFGDVLARDESRVWVAARSTDIVGYLLSQHRSRSETPFSPADAWLEIDQIAVSGQCRRQGVATQLMSHTLALARLQGIHRARLSSWSFNHAAHALFEKFGFAPSYVRFELAFSEREH